MSIRALNWAQHDLPELAMGEAFTLMCLANYADEDDSCFPSQEQLARDVHTSTRTVKRYLKTLRELGLIRVERRSSTFGARANRYILNVGMRLDGRENADIPAKGQIGTLRKSEFATSVDNVAFSQVGPQSDNLALCGDARPQRDTGVPSQSDTGVPLHMYPNHQMEPPTIPTMSERESSARELEPRGVDGAEASRIREPFTVREPVAGAGGAAAPAAPNVDPDALLADCLPAGWLDRLDASARRIVVRSLAQGIAEGFTPSLIRSRLSANKLPPAESIRNFSGLVIHRVGNALAAGREPTAEEREAARHAANAAFVASVLDGTSGMSIAARYNEVMRLSAIGAAESIDGFEAAYRLVTDEYERARARS